MFRLLLFVMVPAFIFSIAGSAKAGCSVEWKHSGGKTFRAIECDESQAALDEAQALAAESCIDLDGEFVDACYAAVAASFRLRREAMLRRTLKEGATLEAAAAHHGYTDEEVAQWIEANEPPPDAYFKESDEVSLESLQAEQALTELLSTMDALR